MVKLSVKEAKNIRERVQGLIWKDNPFALMIRTRFGIHTFGVRFSIDVLILDNEDKVVSIRENLKPYRIFLWNPKYEKVLELPRGTIKKHAIKMHDVVDLKIIK
jgi:uncharacterized protein